MQQTSGSGNQHRRRRSLADNMTQGPAGHRRCRRGDARPQYRCYLPRCAGRIGIDESGSDKDRDRYGCLFQEQGWPRQMVRNT